MVATDDIEETVRNMPRLAAATIAVRAAMRVLPVLAHRSRKRDKLFSYWPALERAKHCLTMLRCCQISMFGAGAPNMDQAEAYAAIADVVDKALAPHTTAQHDFLSNYSDDSVCVALSAIVNAGRATAAIYDPDDVLYTAVLAERWLGYEHSDHAAERAAHYNADSARSAVVSASAWQDSDAAIQLDISFQQDQEHSTLLAQPLLAAWHSGHIPRLLEGLETRSPFAGSQFRHMD